jgi:hypothetical protein
MHTWLLRSLCFETPSDEEKTRRLIPYVAAHPEASAIVAGSGAFGKVWDSRDSTDAA